MARILAQGNSCSTSALLAFSSSFCCVVGGADLVPPIRPEHSQTEVDPSSKGGRTDMIGMNLVQRPPILALVTAKLAVFSAANMRFRINEAFRTQTG
jgi:hypothetical protein